MSDYIVCQKKRNNPRMDVRICERRCPQKGKVELEKVLEARPDFAPARQALQRAGEPPPAPEPTRP